MTSRVNTVPNVICEGRDKTPNPLVSLFPLTLKVRGSKRCYHSFLLPSSSPSTFFFFLFTSLNPSNFISLMIFDRGRKSLSLIDFAFGPYKEKPMKERNQGFCSFACMPLMTFVVASLFCINHISAERTPNW